MSRSWCHNEELLTKDNGDDEEDRLDALFLRAVTESFAEDWDSPEDEYYDTLSHGQVKETK